MLPDGTLLAILPTIASAFFAYLIARKKYILNEKINRARMNTDIQTQALTVVQEVMKEMKEEFRKEIDSLRTENHKLKIQLESSQSQIADLKLQVNKSEQLVDTLRAEIVSLRGTIKMYEDEIRRLKNGM